MRVIIVAGSELIAECLRRTLRYAPNCQVTGYVNGRRPCTHAVAGKRPEMVIIDDMRAPTIALQRIEELRATDARLKIVLVASTLEGSWLDDARRAGIDAAIARDVGPASLGTLVREIAAGTVFHAFAPRPAQPVPQASLQSGLTTRELEILQLVAGGASNSTVAKQLWVTEQTVKFHLSNTYRKLGVANRTQASHMAHVLGLIDRSVQPAVALVPDSIAA
jgi:DNA-binding NarL/FixJ family response regulator